MIFFKSRKIKCIEDRLEKLELKIKQSECDHKIKIFGEDWGADAITERCWNCKKVLTTFEKEEDCLIAKNKYILMVFESNKERIKSLKK